MLRKDVPIASSYLLKYCTFDDLTFVFRTKALEKNKRES